MVIRKKRKRESERERENSLGWISHELSKNPRPLRFAMAERKKKKKKIKRDDNNTSI
jgi:hypothetical protein